MPPGIPPEKSFALTNGGLGKAKFVACYLLAKEDHKLIKMIPQRRIARCKPNFTRNQGGNVLSQSPRPSYDRIENPVDRLIGHKERQT